MEIHIVAVWRKDQKSDSGVELLQWAWDAEVGLKHAHAALDKYSVRDYEIRYWCIDVSGDGVQHGDLLLNAIALAHALRVARSHIMVLNSINKDLVKNWGEGDSVAESIQQRENVLGLWQEQHGDITKNGGDVSR